MLLPCLIDITKYVPDTSIKVIKLTTDIDGNVKVEAVEDASKSIIINGKILKPLPELEGSLGLTELGFLRKILTFFDDKDDAVEVVKETKTFSTEKLDVNGKIECDADGNPMYEQTPKEVISYFKFSRSDSSFTKLFRTAHPNLIPEQVPLSGVVWDYTFVPSMKAIQYFIAMASFGDSSSFGAEIRGTDLFFTFKDGDFRFSEGVNNVKFAKKFEWNITKILPVMKLAESADAEIGLRTQKGAFRILLKSGLGEYEYVFPAKAMR